MRGDYAGGRLAYQDEVLDVQVFGEPPSLLVIEQQRLVFPNGAYLDFQMRVDDTLTARRYGYHFARADHSLIWRLDKHPLAPGGTAVPHIHLPPMESVHTAQAEVDVEDVVQRVYDSGELESLPA